MTGNTSTADTLRTVGRGPMWLRNWLGPDNFDAAVKVYHPYSATDAEMSQIGRLDRLEILHVGGRLTDAGLVHLQGLNKLRILALQNARLSLEYMSIPQSRITDAGVIHLKDLSSLKELAIGLTALTDSGLARLCCLTKLTRLDIDASCIDDFARSGPLPGCRF